MSAKRLGFYLHDAECTILCKHKSQEKFLKGNKENCSIEISLWKLNIKYINGNKTPWQTVYQDLLMPIKPI